MKYKTLFRLVLKLIGVWVFLRGAGELIAITGALVRSLGPGQIIPLGPAEYVAFSLAPQVFQVLCGLYLFFGGEWVVNLAIPGNRPYCPECGYDLSGARHSRCPECGTPFTPEQVRPAQTSASAEERL
ncbi:MAG: hypothetical protein JXA69_02545 [Phycisphaerae bacterium]|nr:hypothetical protein [Phycisphaerae bacterium]